MSVLNNPKNVVGMGSILLDDDEDIDITEIEKAIIDGTPIPTKSSEIDLAKEYKKEIEDMGRRYLGSYSDDSMDVSTPMSSQSPAPSNHSMSDIDDLDDVLKWTPSDITKSSMDDDFSPAVVSSSIPSEDEQLTDMTNEEIKQSHVNRVVGSMDQIVDDSEYVKKEDDEDEIAQMKEQIDLLRGNLESEGVDLSRIPDIQYTTDKKTIKSTLRILQIKNDRMRYCDFFEEVILAAAYGLEGIFDGNREVFGSKINLTGYSDTVKVKLRRMRYDTSNFVSSVMKGYNISSGWRIALELVPSLFLYSRDRKATTKDNLVSDDAYKKAVQDMI